MHTKHSFLRVIFTLIFIPFITEKLQAQCVWQVAYNDDFEYSTPILGLVSGTTYHAAPSSYISRTDNKGFYMNFVNGLASNTLVFSRSYDVCTSSTYRFNAWSSEVNGVSSTVTLQVRDLNNTILASYTNTYVASAGWTQWTTPTFTLTTNTVFFEIIFNSGVSANDFGMDDISLEACEFPATHSSMDFCASKTVFDLYDSHTSLTSISGAWTGPSSLTNGYLGTFTPSINTSGTYTYTLPNANSFLPRHHGVIQYFC